MNISYVCLRCSRRLLRLNGQLRSSSFVSLGQLVGNDDRDAADQEKGSTDYGIGLKRRRPRHEKRKTFAQQYRESRQPSGVDKVLEELFSSKQDPTQAPERSRYSRTPKEVILEPATHEKSVDHRLLELARDLRRGAISIEDAWASCRDLLGQKSWSSSPSHEPGVYRNLGQHNAFRDILLAVCTKGRLANRNEIVTPATVIKLYGEHSLMRYWWHKILWVQLAQVLQLGYAQTGSAVGEDSSKEKRKLMKEILDVWNLFLQRWNAVPGDISLQGEKAPKIHGITNQSRMYHLFSRLFPKHPDIPSIADMAAAAVMTLHCMEAENIDDMSYATHCFRQIKEVCKLDGVVAARCLSDAKAPADVVEKALEGWDHYEKNLLRMSIKRDYGRVPLPKPTQNFGWTKNTFALRMAEIDGTAGRSDAEGALELYSNFARHLKTSEDTDQGIIDRFFARFLRTFWAIRRSDHAIMVWNSMVSSGNTPNQLHWTTMLTGCARAKDVKSLQEIWSNMLRSGGKPDINTWTTYISGLIYCNKWQEGLSALEALGKTWKKSSPLSESLPESHEKGSHIYACIEPVHAALSALIATQRSEHNPKLIAWAESQGLSLTTYTFNILLRPLVRAGTQEHIASHLAQMQSHNCPPDEVTFTIILNGLISNPTSTFHSLPPEEQESTILAILSQLESHSIPANARTYATLLNGVVGKTNPQQAEQTTPNIPAARTILAHMAKRNIPPSPHIYTILATHYFSVSPPDLPAIDSLWASIRHNRQLSNLDPVFYDRLIEGYANIDEYEKALAFLRRMPEEGKAPGWMALAKLIQSLSRAGEWELCEQLVNDAEDVKGGLFRHGEGPLRGKAAFWDEVEQLRARGVIDSGQD